MSFAVFEALSVLVKAALYAATLGAAGGVFFLCSLGDLIGAEDRRLILRRIETGFALAAAASALSVMVIAGSMSGDAAGMFDSSLLHLVWHSGEDGAVMLRMAGLLLAVRVLASRRAAPVPAFLGAACAALSFAWVGHARATGSPWAAAAMAVHLVAVAYWVGALGPLLLLARHGDPRYLAPAAARFGRVAGLVVGALVLAGLTLLWRLLGSASALWASAYGRMAACKLALVACLLGLAAYNRLALTPRLLAGDARAVLLLRRSVRAEIALAGAILVATAALTTLAGAPALD